MIVVNRHVGVCLEGHIWIVSKLFLDSHVGNFVGVITREIWLLLEQFLFDFIGLFYIGIWDYDVNSLIL
jgi:hypothetical protein